MASTLLSAMIFAISIAKPSRDVVFVTWGALAGAGAPFSERDRGRAERLKLCHIPDALAYRPASRTESWDFGQDTWPRSSGLANLFVNAEFRFGITMGWIIVAPAAFSSATALRPEYIMTSA